MLPVDPRRFAARAVAKDNPTRFEPLAAGPLGVTLDRSLWFPVHRSPGFVGSKVAWSPRRSRLPPLPAAPPEILVGSSIGIKFGLQCQQSPQPILYRRWSTMPRSLFVVDLSGCQACQLLPYVAAWGVTQSPPPTAKEITTEHPISVLACHGSIHSRPAAPSSSPGRLLPVPAGFPQLVGSLPMPATG